MKSKRELNNKPKPEYKILFLVLILAVLFVTYAERILESPSGLVYKTTQVSPINCRQEAPDHLTNPPQQISKNEINSLKELTNNISNTYSRYKKSYNTNDAKKLQNDIVKRKKLLVKAMRSDPESFLLSTLTNQQRSDLKSMARNCPETVNTVEGTLEILHADFFEKNTSKTQLVLKTKANKKIVLYPAFGLSKNLISGMKIRVKGLQIDNELAFDGTRSLANTNNDFGGFDVLEAPTIDTIGEQRTIVILVNFQNTEQPSLTSDQIRDVFYNNPDSVNNYYRENSYNQVSFNVDVLGWYTIPLTQSCSYNTASSDLVTTNSIRAVDSSVNFNDYSRLIIVAPFGDCWGGLSTVGQVSVNTQDGNIPLSIAYVNTDIAYVNTNFPGIKVYAHELGHGLGNYHAGFLNCYGASLLLPFGSCFTTLGDIYDLMSGRYVGHFNAYHKDNLGWFSSNKIKIMQSNTDNGQYIIKPIEDATDDVTVLKILNNANKYFYLEYRQPIGFDSAIDSTTTDVFQGGLIHYTYTPIALLYADSLLIDSTPIPDSYGLSSYSSLKPGYTYVDPVGGTRITAISATPDGLIVDVRLGKTDFTPPNVLITSPVQDSIISGDVKIVAGASDESGIQKVEFYIGNVLFGTDAEAPYEAILNARDLSAGFHYVKAYAYDRSGEPYGLPGNIGISPLLRFIVEDTTPPNIQITSPADNSFVYGTVSVKVDASDQSGIQKVEFYIDDTLLNTDSTPPYTRPLMLNYPIGSGHYIRVKAYDNAPVQNVGVSQIRITIKDTNPPTVTITSPTNGAAILGSIKITATASDIYDGISKVGFYIDDILLGYGSTSPYEITFKSSDFNNGDHILQATAYDRSGNTGSSKVLVSFRNPFPTIISPLGGDVISGITEIKAITAEESFTSKVEFFVDGVLLDTDSTAPYEVNLDTLNLKNDINEIKVFAYDILGNKISDKINVFVKNNGPTPPSVLVASPLDQSVYRSDINRYVVVPVKAIVTDNKGIDRIKYYILDVLTIENLLPYPNNVSSTYSGTTSHFAQLNGLLPSTTYYFVINSSDLVGNNVETNELNFTTLSNPFTTKENADIFPANRGGDKSLPVISYIKVFNISGDSAIINWTTDKWSTSVVKYWTLSGFYRNTTRGEDGTRHMVFLLGLLPSTKYYFVVNSTDIAGNSAQSSEHLFTTYPDIYPPIISNINVSSSINETDETIMANITWVTDEPSYSFVKYGDISSRNYPFKTYNAKLDIRTNKLRNGINKIYVGVYDTENNFQVSGPITVFVNTCTDLTMFNRCSFNKPYYCDGSGGLVEDCRICGCPSQYPVCNNGVFCSTTGPGSRRIEP